MRRAAALCVALVLIAPVSAAPVEITIEPISGFHNILPYQDFGPFSWRGGFAMQSADADFGGFSGLVLGKDCEAFTAISDAGKWLTARLTYAGPRLAGIEDAALWPLLDSNGRIQLGKTRSDVEAVTEIAPGQLAVAHERDVRFGTYDFGTDGPAARFHRIASPREIERGEENGEVESLGSISSGPRAGWLLSIAERQWDGQGNARAWLWHGKDVVRFSVTRNGNFEVTDLVILADGTVLTLERSFTPTTFPAMAIRRFHVADIAPGKTVTPELVLEASLPLYDIDNMEGIAACSRDGETRITLVSDNNFNDRLQRNLVLQFAYRP